MPTRQPNHRSAAVKSGARRVMLTCSTSLAVLAFAGAAAAQATTPAAQAAAAAPAADASSGGEIVVTGTRIRGVAPVGSALVSVDQQTIKSSGLTSTADVLSEIPSILTLGTGNSWVGGASQGGDALNSYSFGKSPDMRGLGPQATLSLVNGHRMAYEGLNMNEFDGDNYPVQMLARVEVVQDGTSPIYGADAIAGTVNYILRSPADAVEAYGGYGWANGQHTWFATGIVGHTWNDDSSSTNGGFILSYQHTYQSALLALSRPNLYNDNFAPYGGQSSSTSSAPGNVLVGGVFYAIPGGQNGSALTLSQLGQSGKPNTFTPWAGGIDAIPQIAADHFALNFTQNLTNWLQVFGDGLYVTRDVYTNWPGSGTLNAVSASVPNSNPNSPCNPSHYAGGVVTGPAALVAACATGALNVLYNDVYDAGAPVRTSLDKTWSITGGVRFTLPDDWKLTAEATNSFHSEGSSTGDSKSGVPVPASFNYFCDPTAFTCNTATADAGIQGTPLTSQTTYKDQDYMLNADGPLFELPGGKVRLAVGAEYYTATFININSQGENAVDPRNVKSAYAEFFIPIVGANNAFPGISRLELDIAGRIDDYSDAGQTKNPKIGLNWWPVDDLKIHASYGTSFRAPGLADDDPNVQHAYLKPAVTGAAISSSICPICSTAPAPTAIYQVIGGAAGDLKPETSTSYSVGADWTPKAIPGLQASVNYWWINYANQINYPAYNAGAAGAINQGIYNSLIIYNPTYFAALAANNPVAFFGNFPTVNKSNASCAAVYGQKVTTSALYNSLISCINTGGDGALFGAPAPAANVLAVEDAHRTNSSTTIGEGLDLSASYTRHSDWGTWRIGGVGEYIDKWNYAPFAGGPATSEVNRFGFPLTFKGRAELGWSQDYGFGGLLANLFVNYTNAYKMDLALLPVGVPASYANIAAYTTVDMTLAYDTKSKLSPWLAKDVTVTVSVQNLFDAKPPLVLSQAGSAGPRLLFDPFNASPLGRVIQIQIGKKF